MTALVGLWLGIHGATAAEPVVERVDAGRYRATLDLAASPEVVMALVRDPVAVSRVDGSTTVTATPDGPCLTVQTHVDHPVASVTYRTRSCPDGERAVQQTLIDGDMKAYSSRWRVEPLGAGTRLHYEILAVPTMFVPQFVVDRGTANGTRRLLERVRDHLEP